MCDLFESYTVGTGLVLQPASSSPEFNQAAKDHWENWSREPDLGSRQPFGILQSVISRGFIVDGEEFMPLVIDDEGNPKIQLLEADQVRTPDGMVDSPALSDGVVLDRYGKPTGYYVAGHETPIPAASMVHIFEPSRAGQVRGIPFLHPALNDLADLEEVQGLTKQCVKNDATLWSVIKTQTGELTPAMMRAARFGVVKPTPSGTTATACATQDAGTYYQQVFGTTAKVLRTGDSWESFSSDRPSANAQEFMRDLAEKIAAGTGFPLVLVLPESLQGTVARGTYEMANAYFRARSLVLANAFSTLYEFVISTAKNKVPALRDPPADWRKVTIRPPRSVNVDPGYRSTAAINDIKAGATNYEILYSELGLDWKEEFDKLKEHQGYAKKIGLILEMPGLEETLPGTDEAATGVDGDSDINEDAAGAAAAGADVAKLALNGAQLAAVQELITQVAQKQLPAEAAKRALYIALPLTDPADIDAMVDAAAAFTPETQEEAVTA
jgi:capsid protein